MSLHSNNNLLKMREKQLSYPPPFIIKHTSQWLKYTNSMNCPSFHNQQPELSPPLYHRSLTQFFAELFIEFGGCIVSLGQTCSHDHVRSYTGYCVSHHVTNLQRKRMLFTPNVGFTFLPVVTLQDDAIRSHGMDYTHRSNVQG